MAEIFQKKLNQAIGDLPGVLCVADDILIYGVVETTVEALKDHDKKMLPLLKRCEEAGTRLNKEKIQLHHKSIPFLGHLITDEGLLPDPDKVRAIDEKPPPVDVQGVQRLNGFVNYLAKFLPGLSETLEPIRQLTRKDVPWNWGPAQEAAFKEVKDLMKEAPCLKYFHSKKPLVIQCDASEGGLGAVLLQDGYPISYASRALTDVEVRYA